VTPPTQTTRNRLIEVAVFFLRLGFTAFGGPAAHIAMMHDEVVKRRKWVDEQRFLDLFGAANMIPGPSSTEMAIYLGFQRAGWPGLVLSGVWIGSRPTWLKPVCHSFSGSHCSVLS